MTKTITQNDVLRYLYNETSKDENAFIEREIICNDSFADFFYEMSEVIASLSTVKLSPSEKSINNILEYSRMKIQEAPRE